MGSRCWIIQTLRRHSNHYPPPPPPHGALTKRLLCRHFRYSLLLYMVHVVFKTATQVGKLTPCSISVSSRLRLRHLAAASLFLSRLTLLFSSSSGVNCMHNRSDELPCRHRNSFWHPFIMYHNTLHCSMYMNKKVRLKHKPVHLFYVVLGRRRWSGWPLGAWGLCGQGGRDR